MNALRASVVMGLGIWLGGGFACAAEAPAPTAPATPATNEVVAKEAAVPAPATNAVAAEQAVVPPSAPDKPVDDGPARTEPARDESAASASARDESAGSARTSAVRDFSHFRLIVERNIFNPSRRKPSPSGRSQERRAPSPRTETLTLTGAICYGGKAFAFFDGSEPGWRGVFSPGDKLGDWTLAKVDTDGVRLEGGDKPWELRVGRSLRRRGDEPWEVSKDPAPVSGSRTINSASGSPSADKGAAAGGVVPAGLSDIMKRLMERRKQQESQ